MTLSITETFVNCNHTLLVTRLQLVLIAIIMCRVVVNASVNHIVSSTYALIYLREYSRIIWMAKLNTFKIPQRFNFYYLNETTIRYIKWVSVVCRWSRWVFSIFFEMQVKFIHTYLHVQLFLVTRGFTRLFITSLNFKCPSMFTVSNSYNSIDHARCFSSQHCFANQCSQFSGRIQNVCNL